MTQYNSLFLLKDRITGKMIFKYWASSGEHKAVFSSRKRAERVTSTWLKHLDIEIIEVK